jgi:hypothetical protein
MAANPLREWRLACPKGSADLVFPNTRGNVDSLPNMHRRGLRRGSPPVADAERRPRAQPVRMDRRRLPATGARRLPRPSRRGANRAGDAAGDPLAPAYSPLARRNQAFFSNSLTMPVKRSTVSVSPSFSESDRLARLRRRRPDAFGEQPNVLETGRLRGYSSSVETAATCRPCPARGRPASPRSATASPARGLVAKPPEERCECAPDVPVRP